MATSPALILLIVASAVLQSAEGRRTVSTSELETLARELREEMLALSEVLQGTSGILQDYNIVCVDLGIDLAFAAFGPLLPLVFPPGIVGAETIEYLVCIERLGRSNPQCQIHIDSVARYLKDLPSVLVEFTKDYFETVGHIPRAITDCIHTLHK